MKKIIAVVAIALSSYAASAQIHVKLVEPPTPPNATVVGKVTFGIDVHAKLMYIANSTDTVYTLMYLDLNYKQTVHYKSLTFSSRQMPLQNLYQSLKAAFLPQNLPTRTQTTFMMQMPLGGTQVMLTNFKTLKTIQVAISTEDGNIFGLTEKQVEQLFGHS